MSIKSAQAFIERIQNDEDFRKELEERASEEERMKFAKARGFDFTKEEIDELKDTLTDDELNKVAGGGCWDIFHWCQKGDYLYDKLHNEKYK
ncbi:MAG: Nif11-like leader peptide family natural product precursor [bacterium]|nr:Nif11-like leader peptide family natural product precursor [bacterium]MCP4634672.1 Nif11-like leader peptide family natural product precursor [candidate division Zixibacteria bacterium]